MHSGLFSGVLSPLGQFLDIFSPLFEAFSDRLWKVLVRFGPFSDRFGPIFDNCEI